MTTTDLQLSCQLRDCRNRAVRTVTLDLPTKWSAAREYGVRTLQVAACGECAVELEACGRALLDGRVQYARRMEMVADNLELTTQLVALIETIGPPFEPVQGGNFAHWLSRLDRLTAQSAWRLLAHVKRKALEESGAGPRRHVEPSPPAGRGRRDRAATRPVSIEDARFRRRVLVPPVQPPPDSPARPVRPSPGGGDDAA